MLGKTKFLSLLDTLTGEELTEEKETLIESLKNDFTEKEEILSKYGTIEDEEEYVFTENEPTNVDESYDELKKQYDDLTKKYRERFFYGDPEEKEKEIEEDPEEEEEISLDDLIYM